MSSDRTKPMRPSGGGKRRDVPKPDLPAGEEPELPKGVIREVRRYAKSDEADDVALALSIGTAAVGAGEAETALPYLRWARSMAGRSGTIRETLGLALYHAEQYREALSELRSYRRLTDRLDQNHVIADCLRAVGEESGRVAEDIKAMLGDDDIPAERRLEGIIVWAGALADGGDPAGGLAVLRRAREITDGADLDDDTVNRLMYVEADLCERNGDRDRARALFERLANRPGDSFDAGERAAAV